MTAPTTGTTTTPAAPVALTGTRAGDRRAQGGMAGRVRRRLTSSTASIVAIVIALLWTLPTFGLFVSSFRPPLEIRRNGWWNIFTNPEFTLENYSNVLFGGGATTQLSQYFINSIVITIPAVIMPLVLAALASYAFAWISFPGRDWLFVAVFALQIVPLQVALIPLLQLYSQGRLAGVTILPGIELAGTFWTVWLSHTMFALPLAIFLLHNFMKEIPGEILEAARVDGAGHVRIFFSVLLPLITPALAAFGIFQFLWVWNDLLVALVFAGGTPDVAPLTVRVAELAGTRGQNWQVLTAAAFITIIVPLVVFLSLQRYFVRGLLAGGLKG